MGSNVMKMLKKNIQIRYIYREEVFFNSILIILYYSKIYTYYNIYTIYFIICIK